MADRREQENAEMRTLIRGLSDQKIKECIDILEKELASRSKSDASEPIPKLVLRKCECEGYPCCWHNENRQSCAHNATKALTLPRGSVIVEACKCFYRVYRIGNDNTSELVQFGKRGSFYKFITITEEVLKERYLRDIQFIKE